MIMRGTLRTCNFVSLMALLTIGCARPADEPPVRAVRAVQVGDVERLTQGTLPGRALPSREVNLSFRVGGELAARPVALGDAITRGQLLAQIDPRDYRVQIRTYEGELAANRALYEQQRADLERTLALRERGAAAQPEVDRVRTRVDELEGRIQMVEAALDNARNRLADTELRAPFDGVVAAIYAEPFQTIQPHELVMRILDTSRIKVQVDVPEQLMSAVPFVTEVICTFDAFPDVAIPAKVHEIGTEASPVTRTYPVTVIMDPPEGTRILPGMAATILARAELPPANERDGIEIPLAALGRDGDAAWVWHIDPESLTVRRREVEIGPVVPRGVRVRGLSPGDWIATAGVYTLREGQRVRVPDLEDAASGSGGT